MQILYSNTTLVKVKFIEFNAAYVEAKEFKYNTC